MHVQFKYLVEACAWPDADGAVASALLLQASLAALEQSAKRQLHNSLAAHQLTSL